MPVVAAIEAPVIAAIIAAVASLVVALYSQRQSRRTSVRLAELENERDEKRARRDYEYEARKRLYEECEPLLFQAAEQATLARSRVASLARTARNGNLGIAGDRWLAGPGYYFMSTAYMLIAPATSFRLLQRRLTVIDLNLVPRLRVQYELLKLVFLSFNEDFDLAAESPALKYEPDKSDPEEPERDRLLAEAPEIFARQGLYRGVLDVVVDALIIDAGDGAQRVMGFGEFLIAWEHPGSELYRVRDTLLELLIGFHPLRKPVLWRVLLAQHMLHTVLLRDDPLGAALAPPSKEDMKVFDWRQAGVDDSVSDDDMAAPARAAHAYATAKLAEVAARLRAPTAA